MAVGYPFGVASGEITPRPVDFPTNLQHLGPALTFKSEWDRTNGFGVVGYIVTASTVAASCSQNQHALFIPQRRRHAIDFWINDVMEFYVREGFLYPLVKGEYITPVVGVLNAQHPCGMGYGLKSFDRLAGYTLRRRVGRSQSRILGLGDAAHIRI